MSIEPTFFQTGTGGPLYYVVLVPSKKQTRLTQFLQASSRPLKKNSAWPVSERAGANLIREKCNSCTLEEGGQFTIVVLGDCLWWCVSGVACISNTYMQWYIRVRLILEISVSTSPIYVLVFALGCLKDSKISSFLPIQHRNCLESREF